MSNPSVAVTRDDEVLIVDDATIERTSGIFDAIEPFSGIARAGRSYNFAGALLPEHITQDWPEARDPGMRTTSRPQIHDGEVFAEWYSIVRSIDLARDNYLMVSVGGLFGAPIVNAHKVLQQLKPIQGRFIAFEPAQNTCQALLAHLAENKIDPNLVTLNQVIVSNSNRPKLFIVFDDPTSGLNRAVSPEEVRRVLQRIRDNKIAGDAVKSLLLEGEKVITYPSFQDYEALSSKLEMVSAVTLGEAINPHKRVDYLEMDIQGAEYIVLPPAMELLNDHVAWMHLGTHEQVPCEGPSVTVPGNEAQRAEHSWLRNLFLENGWDIHIDWLPRSEYFAPNGKFRTSDGVLAMRNPRLT